MSKLLLVGLLFGLGSNGPLKNELGIVPDAALWGVVISSNGHKSFIFKYINEIQRDPDTKGMTAVDYVVSVGRCKHRVIKGLDEIVVFSRSKMNHFGWAANGRKIEIGKSMCDPMNSNASQIIGGSLPAISYRNCDGGKRAFNIVDSNAIDADIGAQLALSIVLGDAISIESNSYGENRHADCKDKRYNFANSGSELIFRPLDHFVSRISHASLGAQIGFLASVWAAAIGLIYFGFGYLGWCGVEKWKGWRIFLLFNGFGWALWAFPWYVILSAP